MAVVLPIQLPYTCAEEWENAGRPEPRLSFPYYALGEPELGSGSKTSSGSTFCKTGGLEPFSAKMDACLDIWPKALVCCGGRLRRYAP